MNSSNHNESQMIESYADLVSCVEEMNHFNDTIFVKELEKQNVHTLLLMLYRYSQIIDEWSVYLSALMVKVPSQKERSVIVKLLYDQNVFDYTKTPPNIPHLFLFEKFLKIFDEKKPINFSSAYYKRHSLLLPIEKFCFEMTTIITTNKWQYTVAVMAMIQYIKIFANKCISKFVNNLFEIEGNSQPNLDISYFDVAQTMCANQMKELCTLLIGQGKELVFDGLKKGYEIVNTFYDSLVIIFDK